MALFPFANRRKKTIRPNTSAPLNPFSKGRLNQMSGARFEAAINYMASRDGLLLVHNGVKAKRLNDRVVLNKSNVDFFLLGRAELGQFAFIDAKAFSGNRFGRSAINPRQLALCMQYAQRGMTSGFVVYLKKCDSVGFYSAQLLSSGAARRGFGVEDGVALGPLQNFSLHKIWQSAPRQERLTTTPPRS